MPKQRQNTPKAHHFVPKLLLNNFTDALGWLHVFHKNVGHLGVIRRRPGEEFLRNHLISEIKPDVSRDARLEFKLNELETVASPVLKK